jgi:hypothetical protein
MVAVNGSPPYIQPPSSPGPFRETVRPSASHSSRTIREVSTVKRADPATTIALGSATGSEGDASTGKAGRSQATTSPKSVACLFMDAPVWMGNPESS